MGALIDTAEYFLMRSRGARAIRVPTSGGDVNAYERLGSGARDYVLLHGIGASAASYAALVPLLARDARRVLVVDLPGHGLSAVPRDGVDASTLQRGLLEALDALVLPGSRPLVVGTSLGGAAALRYALARPAVVSALVLVSPAGAPLTAEELAAVRARFAIRTADDARRFIDDLLHAPPWYRRAIEVFVTKQLSRPLVQEMLAGVDDTAYFSADELAGLAMPTAILWGKSDGILPRSSFEFFRRAMPPGTRFRELDGVGHSAQSEAPRLIAAEIRALYAQVEADAHHGANAA